jgi:hypothetical protein
VKNFFWVAAGLCAATLGFIFLGAKRLQPVDELTHGIQDAWADNHTVV